MRTDITLSEQHEFEQGYVEAIVWANSYRETSDGLEPADVTLADVELDDEVQEVLWQDCLDFLTPQAVRLIDGACRRGDRYLTYGLAGAGHDFALTRNRHGAGFWDRGFGLVGEALSELARPYGERSLWVDGGGVAHLL